MFDGEKYTAKPLYVFITPAPTVLFTTTLRLAHATRVALYLGVNVLLPLPDTPRLPRTRPFWPSVSRVEKTTVFFFNSHGLGGRRVP